MHGWLRTSNGVAFFIRSENWGTVGSEAVLLGGVCVCAHVCVLLVCAQTFG